MSLCRLTPAGALWPWELVIFHEYVVTDTVIDRCVCVYPETKHEMWLIKTESMEWFYVTSVTTTKFALLLLYLRIFAVSTRFRLAVYFVATTVALWAIVLYIVLVCYIFSCGEDQSLLALCVKETCPSKGGPGIQVSLDYTDESSIGSAV